MADQREEGGPCSRRQPPAQPRPGAVPLRRNRDFMLLQTGQLLSSLGTQSTSIAYPLLVLALTHSSARAGLVGFARIAAAALLALPAGLAADRFDRRRLMIAADAVRVARRSGRWPRRSCSATVRLLGDPCGRRVEGARTALFSAVAGGALRAVVPPPQLPAAAGAQTGRQAAVQLGGPPSAGRAVRVARALPFVVDAMSYASRRPRCCYANAVPGGARAATAPRCGRTGRRHPLPLGPAVPAHLRPPLRPRQPHRPGLLLCTWS